MRLERSTISLDNVRIYAYHGVMEQERRVGAWYRVSVAVDYPFAKALETDDVADTLNYATVFELVKSEMSIPSNLLESVAGRIARRIINEFPATKKVEIRLTKDNPPMSANVDGASVFMSFINE